MYGVDLYWIPLGAGQSVVRLSGRVFEAAAAWVHHRPSCDLYHTALIVTVPTGRFVIEMTPVPDRNGARRGVVVEGPVGTKWAGRFRVFRYEVRRWNGGSIPDAQYAAAIEPVCADVARAQRLLDAVESVPATVWGRDELGAGGMWNSNSVTAWLLSRAGIDTTGLCPPGNGRAPGWSAGLVVAGRSDRVTLDG